MDITPWYFDDTFCDWSWNFGNPKIQNKIGEWKVDNEYVLYEIKVKISRFYEISKRVGGWFDRVTTDVIFIYMKL